MITAELSVHLCQNTHFIVNTDHRSGQISEIFMKGTVLEYVHVKRLTPENYVQPGAAVVFAEHGNGGACRGVALSAASWEEPESTVVNTGPLFFSVVRKGRLRFPQKAEEKCPILEVAYKFFADKPYFLLSSRLAFADDTDVFGVRNEIATVANSCFSHYCFRPVTPTLADTDVEEVGHLLVDEEDTRTLPQGIMFSNFLPYDLAWHAFINTVMRKEFRFRYAMAGLRLAESSRSPGGDAPRYRHATYLSKDNGALSWHRAAVYVKTQDCGENVVRIPAGTVYEETNALYFAEWDERKRWLAATDELGKRLNNRLQISIHPRFLGGVVPPEEFELLPVGDLSLNYSKAGVR